MISMVSMISPGFFNGDKHKLWEFERMRESKLKKLAPSEERYFYNF